LKIVSPWKIIGDFGAPKFDPFDPRVTSALMNSRLLAAEKQTPNFEGIGFFHFRQGL
jgi:hypothetical protein